MIMHPYRDPDPEEARSLEEQVLEALADEAALLSPATVRAYAADWKAFQSYCEDQGAEYLPAEPATLAAFLLEQSKKGVKASTISRRCAAITHYHNNAGFDAPSSASLVRRARRAIRRKIGTQKAKKSPLKIEELKKAIDKLSTRLIGKRDRALLLLGFAGGFRRSELVALTTADIVRVGQGMIVTLQRSKTDQEAKGILKGIPYGKDPQYCPVIALQEWMDAAGITTGPIFRSVDRHGNVGEKPLRPQTVGDIVKAAALSIDLAPERFAGHSLRAGLVTSAAEEGADVYTIMLTTGHKSQEMVKEYIREAALFKNNAATKAGL